MEFNEYVELVTSQINELSRRIADFENVKSENISLKQKIDSQQKVIDGHFKLISDLQDKLSKNLSTQERYNFINDEKNEIRDQKFNEINSLIKGLSTNILGHNSELINLKNDIFVLLNSSNLLKNEIEKAKESHSFCNAGIKELSGTLSGLINCVEKNKLNYDSICETFYNNNTLKAKELISLNEKISFLSSQIAKISSESEHSILHTKNILQSEIENLSDKFNSISIPDVSSFICTNELNDLKREFNLCSLDSINSISKCNNLESQLTIFCKKIDNIQIYLKSIELKLVDESSKQLK